jgi:hypothetical protein
VNATTAIRVPGFDGPVGAIAADPVRDRMLVVTATDGPATVSAVQVDTARTLTKNTFRLGTVSLAVTRSDIWMAGYGGPYGQRLTHLRPDRLISIGSTSIADQVGPGAAIWPGTYVVWVRSGRNEDLICMGAADGSVKARWRDIQGPVVTSNGNAVTISAGVVVALELDGTGCNPG